MMKKQSRYVFPAIFLALILGTVISGQIGRTPEEKLCKKLENACNSGKVSRVLDCVEPDEREEIQGFLDSMGLKNQEAMDELLGEMMDLDEYSGKIRLIPYMDKDQKEDDEAETDSATEEMEPEDIRLYVVYKSDGYREADSVNMQIVKVDGKYYFK